MLVALCRCPASFGSPRPGRALLALPPAALIAYCLWRAGEQVTGGLDPNFTVNAWGGPSYLGAMACHCLDIALAIGGCAWLLDLILLEGAAEGMNRASNRL